MILARTVVYATLFITLLLVVLPRWILARTGFVAPAELGVVEAIGATLTAFGAVLALWCIATFVRLGQGTPAPFDPPRRLVIRGPYRFLRNPMYVGAFFALTGLAIVYRSAWLLAYAITFIVVMHAVVVLHEEPALGRTFGEEYERYRRETHRWWPRPTRR